MTHFLDESQTPLSGPLLDYGRGVTLCGLSGIAGVVWRDNPKADCRACVDAWRQRGWTFPLPELVYCDS